MQRVVVDSNKEHNFKNETKTVELETLEAYSALQLFQKRVVDYIMVLILLVVTWPIILYSIYRIKKESPGSILFKQQRIGLNGKTFTCYKFRSMHSNSHFNPYTQDNDSRIFPYGHIMRRMRIDELAQILNVLKGDMHIVGPRAEWNILVDEYRKSISNYDQRHKVRPGITGLAQVKYPYGRNLYDAKKKFVYDLIYIRNWSIVLEVKILFETVFVVLKRSGV